MKPETYNRSFDIGGHDIRKLLTTELISYEDAIRLAFSRTDIQGYDKKADGPAASCGFNL